MSYGELALEVCTITGGVFMTFSAILSIVAAVANVPAVGWIVVGVPLLAASTAALVVWRLGFGPLGRATAETVVTTLLIVGVTTSLFAPMIVGVLLVPAGGVPLLWIVFGVIWATTALAATGEAIRDWVTDGPTSVPLDVVAIAAALLSVASLGWLYGLGMTGLLYGTVFIGGLLGVSVGAGFLAAEELVEPEERATNELSARSAHHGHVAHA